MSTRDQIDLNNILDGERNWKHLAKAMEADNLNSNMQTKKRNKNPTTTNTPTKQSLSTQISTENTSITNGGEDLGTPGADTTIELTDNTVVTEEDPYMHRKTMEGRPARDCAADHPKWRKSKSLAYTFLTVEPNSIAYNAIGQIEKCRLRCGLCITGGAGTEWNWASSSRGSTSNYIEHFNSNHKRIYQKAEEVDNVALGKANAKETSDQTVLPFGGVSQNIWLTQRTHPES